MGDQTDVARKLRWQLVPTINCRLLTVESVSQNRSPKILTNSVKKEYHISVISVIWAVVVTGVTAFSQTVILEADLNIVEKVGDDYRQTHSSERPLSLETICIPPVTVCTILIEYF